MPGDARGMLSLAAVLLLPPACQAGRDAPVPAAEAAVADTPPGGAQVARLSLPPALREVSGLATAGDGLLYAHNDERGIVFVLDAGSGQVRRNFTLGRGVRGDFEGIAAGGDRLYLVTSDGDLFGLPAGAGGAGVDYERTDTGFGDDCEIEGLAWDARRAALLVACKNPRKKRYRGQVVVLRWTPDSGPGPVLQVPEDAVLAGTGLKSFHPTGIEVDPRTGNYVLIAGPEAALTVLTPEGRVVWTRRLPRGRHRQAEGVAFLGDSLLAISDEGGAGPATLTLYRWPWP